VVQATAGHRPRKHHHRRIRPRNAQLRCSGC